MVALLGTHNIFCVFDTKEHLGDYSMALGAVRKRLIMTDVPFGDSGRCRCQGLSVEGACEPGRGQRKASVFRSAPLCSLGRGAFGKSSVGFCGGGRARPGTGSWSSEVQ